MYLDCRNKCDALSDLELLHWQQHTTHRGVTQYFSSVALMSSSIPVPDISYIVGLYGKILYHPGYCTKSSFDQKVPRQQEGAGHLQFLRWKCESRIRLQPGTAHHF